MPYPWRGPRLSSVCNTIRSRVPCMTSTLGGASFLCPLATPKDYYADLWPVKRKEHKADGIAAGIRRESAPQGARQAAQEAARPSQAEVLGNFAAVDAAAAARRRASPECL